MDSPDKSHKKDRTARLVLVEYILDQNPEGIIIGKIADICGVSRRTTYRDLKALENELGIKIWEEGNKRGLLKDQYLSPVRFSVIEALNIFLATRLMVGYANRFVPNIVSTFTKLNTVMPSPLKNQITKTIDWMQKLPVNEQYQRTMISLAEAWMSQRQVRISYQSLSRKKPAERTIEPYFIEPAASGHSSYVIAYCHLAKEIRTFKMERIISIHPTMECYVIPPDFDINRYLGSAWGIVVEGDAKPIDVKLKFSPEISRIISEPVWHPSQVFESQEDGSLLMKLEVTNTVELYRWIMGWGDQVEVLEPDELRNKMFETTGSMLDLYS